MQEVYHDGSGGPVEELNPEVMEKALDKPEVHHVEVFKKGTPAHSDAVRRIKKRAKKKGIIR